MQTVREDSSSPFLFKDAVPIVGLSLFWAWTSLTFYCPLLFSAADDASGYTSSMWIWTSWAQAITFLAIAGLSRFVKTLLERRGAIALFSSAAVMGTLLMSVVSYVDAVMPGLAAVSGLVGSVVVGMTGACIVLMWAEALCRLGLRTAVLGMNVALIASAAIYLAIISLPFEVATILIVAAPGVIGLLLTKTRAKLPASPLIQGSDQPKRTRSMKFLLPLGICFLCAICGEIFRNIITMTLSDDGFTTMGNLYVLTGGCGVLLLTLILWSIKSKRFIQSESAYSRREGLAIRSVLIIMVIGFAITAIFDVSIFVGYAFFCAMFWCLRALSWMYSARIVVHGGISPLIVYGLSLSAFSLPVALSVSAMQALASGLSDGTIPWASVVMVMITLLFILAIFILDPKDINSNWGLSAKETPSEALARTREEELSFLKEDYGLTNREFDVAVLLDKGRNIPFIQNELHIAEGTALTHLRHIYQKLGVHSRQEFISVLEVAVSERTDLEDL